MFRLLRRKQWCCNPIALSVKPNQRECVMVGTRWGKRNWIGPWWGKKIRWPLWTPIFTTLGDSSLNCLQEAEDPVLCRRASCYAEAANTPRLSDSDVFVRQEIPQSMWPWILSASGFVRRRSRNRNEAIVAMRKQPSVIISGRDDCSEMIRCSRAARTEGDRWL